MLRKCLDNAMNGLLALGCLALFAMMLLTAADVGMRYFFNRPITASYELSEILMGIMSPIALLYCGYKNEHVSVDILFTYLSPRAQAFCLLVANGVVLVITALLAWQGWYMIIELRESGLSSPTLNIPMWPVACMFMLAFTIYIPVAIMQMRQGAES